MNLNLKSEHSIPQTTQSTSFLPCIWLIQGLIDAACEVKNFYPCEGIQDSLGLWIPQSGFQIPGTQFFVSRTWIVDSNLLVGFRIP